MPPYARVSVNIPQLSGLFDYDIPGELEGQIQPGTLVNMPFGRQTVQGVVVSLVDEPAVPDTKAIEALVDSEPVLTDYQLQLAAQMAKDNLATLSQCLDLMIPPGLSQHSDILIRSTAAEIPAGITPTQNACIDLLNRRARYAVARWMPRCPA